MNQTSQTPPAPGASAQQEDPPRLSIVIKPTTLEGGSIRRSKGQFATRAATLGSTLRFLHNVSSTRMVVAPGLDGQRYAITATMSDGSPERLEPLVVSAIEASLKIRVSWEERDVDAFVLSATAETPAKLKPNPSGSGTTSDDVGVITAQAVPVVALVQSLEGVFKRPVIDETNLKGDYDWTLLFDAKNPDTLVGEVRKELGLELKRATRKVRMLVVTPVEQK